MRSTRPVKTLIDLSAWRTDLSGIAGRNRRLFGMLPRKNFLELFIAWRYLRGQGRTVIFNLGARLSLIFMASMVFLMVIVLCVFTGFQKEVQNTLWSSGYHIIVSSEPAGAPLRDYRKLLEAIQKDPLAAPRIRSVFPSIQLNGLLEVQNRYEGKAVRAIPVADADLKRGVLPDFPRLVHSNRQLLERLNSGNYVIVGREMARYFGWSLGSRIRLLVPQGGVLTRGIQVREEEFVIAGLFRTGYYEFDLNLIFMSLATAQRTLGLGDASTEVIVQLRDLSHLDLVEQRVRNSLPGSAYTYYAVRTLRQEKGNFLAALQLEKTMMLVILSMLIFAGAFGIWVTVHMLVKSKARSIGMLRAMGMPSSSIIAIFTAHSMWIGFLAAAIGGSLGLFMASRLESALQLIEDLYNASCSRMFGSCEPLQLIPKHIYYFDHLPVSADVTIAFGVCLATMILSGLAGYFPSLVAARIDPVKTIRAE